MKFRKTPKPVVSHRRKVNWLLRNQFLWEGFPKLEYNHRRRIFRAMQMAGLYSVHTNWNDVAIEQLISDARRVRRELAYKTDTGKPYAKN